MAHELVPGDEFTINGGETWRTVQGIEPSILYGDKIIFGRDTNGKRFWLYREEKVVVK